MAQRLRAALVVTLVVTGGLIGSIDLWIRPTVSAAWAQADRAGRMVRFVSADIARATSGSDTATGASRVDVRLSRDAATRLRDFTTAHVGRVIEIRVDGRVVSRPMIREPIAGGMFVISGNLTAQDARAMAAAFGTGTATIEFDVVD